MSNCIPCPPCEIDVPLTCEPYGTVTKGNRLMVEDDAFCTKTLATPNAVSTLVYDNGIKWQTGLGWKSITTLYYASSGEHLSVNSSGAPILIYLPKTPGQFEEITFADHYGTWGTNNVTLDRNGSLIEGLAENLILNTTWPNQIILRFEGSTWRVYAII